MKTLAKHIEQQLGEREFCVVFEDEVERCWPRENSGIQNETGKSKLLPNLMGGSPSFTIPILVAPEPYSGSEVEGRICPLVQSVGVRTPDMRSHLFHR
jgi:hypothetical protein